MVNSSFSSHSRRRGKHVPKPKVDKGEGKGEEAVQVCIGNKIPIITTFDLNEPSKDGYKSGIQAVSSAFSHNRVFGSDLANVLMYERFVFDDISAFALINRQEVRLLAVITSESGETVVVLVDEQEFVDVENYLKKEEGLVAAEFLYYSSPAEYSIEQVSCGIDLLRNDMSVISEMNAKSVRVYENALVFGRFFYMFVVPAILPKWLEFFSEVMDDADDGEVYRDVDDVEVYRDVIYLTKDMVNMWKNWEKVSDFVHSGGGTQLPSELKILNLEGALSQLSILKSSDMKTPFVPTKYKRSYHTEPSDKLPHRVSGAGPSLLAVRPSFPPAGSLTDVPPSLLAVRPSFPSMTAVPGAPTGVPGAPAGVRGALPTAGLSLMQRILKFFKKVPK